MQLKREQEAMAAQLRAKAEEAARSQFTQYDAFDQFAYKFSLYRSEKLEDAARASLEKLESRLQSKNTGSAQQKPQVLFSYMHDVNITRQRTDILLNLPGSRETS